MAYTPEMIRYFLIGKGLNPADAEKFSKLPWVGSIANGEIALPPGLPELNGDSIAAFKKQAKDAGVPLTEFAQQKLAPSTIQTAAAGPPVQAGVAAAGQQMADIPQPAAPAPLGAPAPMPAAFSQAPITDTPLGATGFGQAPTLGGPMNEKQAAITREATRLGVSPTDLATVMDYETIGSMSPSKRGGKGGNYLGLIQFGPAERKKYGVSASQSFDEQAAAAGQFLTDRGLPKWLADHPDATEQEKRTALYSTINAGSPGEKNWGKSDGKYTVSEHTERMFNGPEFDRASALMGDSGPSPFEQGVTPTDIASVPVSPDGVTLAGGAPRPPEGPGYLGAFLQPGAPVPDVQLTGNDITPASWLGTPSPETTLAAPPMDPATLAPPTAEWTPPNQQAGTAADFGWQPTQYPTPPPPDLSTNWTPPQFAAGDFGPPTPPPLMPGPPVLGGAGGDFLAPQGADTLGTAYGAPVLGSAGSDLAASGDGSLGQLIDPSMPLPTRAPMPPLPPPEMSLAPRAMPTMPPQPQIGSLAANPPSLPPDIAQPPLPPPLPLRNPGLPPPMADLAMPLPLRNPGAPPPLPDPNMPLPTRAPPPPPSPPINGWSLDSTGFPPQTPGLADWMQPSPMAGGAPAGPAGTIQSPTDPKTYIPSLQTQNSIDQPQMNPFDPATAPPLGAPTMPPNAPGLTVSGTTGFPPTPMGMAGWPQSPLQTAGMVSIPGTPSFAGAPSMPAPPPAPNMLSPGLPTPSEGFSPTAGPTGTSPMVGDTPVMPSWAMPGAFGMPQAGPGNIGGFSPGQYAGGTSVPTSMASSTGPYMGIGPNPATTLGQTDFGAGAPGALGMIGPGPQPGMTDWSKTGRLTGGIGGGPISEGASPAPAGNAASSAAMENHAIALMQAQHAANYAQSMNNLTPHLAGVPRMGPITQSAVMGLTSMPRPMQSDLIRPYGMNVGFSPSFGSRF